MLMLRRSKGPTARARARKTRKDGIVAAVVRELVEARDGHCRYGFDVPPTDRTRCDGPAEWAHFGEHKRFKTRGMAPEKRHTTAGSLMLCRAHHRAYDSGELEIDAHYDVDGCDGPLEYDA